jgi:hypothetical protein
MCKILVGADMDVILVDSSQGDSIYQFDMVQHLKTTYPVCVVKLHPSTNEELMPENI